MCPLFEPFYFSFLWISISNISQAPAKKEKGEKVKRAPSAYIIFCTEKRTEIKEANPEATFGELGKLLGAAWGAMDEKALMAGMNNMLSQMMGGGGAGGGLAALMGGIQPQQAPRPKLKSKGRKK